MSVEYNVELDRDALREAISLFEFVGGNSDDALRVAINKAGPKVKTLAGRKIREQVSLKAAYVNDRLTFKRATRKDLSGAIGTPSRGLLLSRFSSEPNVANASVAWIKPPPNPYGGHYVKIKPGQPEKKIGRGGDSKPFYIVLKGSRALGIARRTSSGAIDVLHGPSLSQVFDDVRGDVLPDAGAELQAQLLDAMRYLLAKQYPREA
ncbi:MAG TPA: phage tail protein [Thiomonas arsenitoxydans]|uniref:hypothetical protein n=1 Tax=Thiomonas arsenitoxydans (strain DSM 22701 / CIP 110005 / 3As) TaxID=426114 RepID=UPI002C0E68F3|nr:hypothetical protein [Thiomonas arsenitoxydans]HML83159.1 phage tail protein [Thiomonas arsenitoxydans]